MTFSPPVSRHRGLYDKHGFGERSFCARFHIPGARGRLTRDLEGMRVSIIYPTSMKLRSGRLRTLPHLAGSCKRSLAGPLSPGRSAPYGREVDRGGLQVPGPDGGWREASGRETGALEPLLRSGHPRGLGF